MTTRSTSVLTPTWLLPPSPDFSQWRVHAHASIAGPGCAAARSSWFMRPRSTIPVFLDGSELWYTFSSRGANCRAGGLSERLRGPLEEGSAPDLLFCFCMCYEIGVTSYRGPLTPNHRAISSA